ELTAKTIGIIAEPVKLSAENPSAARRSGIAVCQRRSPVLSECRPHRIMSTAAMPYGIELTKPVCRLVSPNDFRIWGCHTDSTLPVAEAPAQTSAMVMKYLLVASCHSERRPIGFLRAASASIRVVSQA